MTFRYALFPLCFALASCAALGVGQKSQEIVVLGKASADVPTVRMFIEATGAGDTLTPKSTVNGVSTWVGTSGISVDLDEGLVVQTRGFGDDMMSSDVSNSIRASKGQSTGEYYERFHTSLGGDLETEFRAFQCTIDGRKSETARIGGTSYNTTKTTEVCATPGFTVNNTYWRGSDGTLRKSRQWVSEGVGYLILERQSR